MVRVNLEAQVAERCSSASWAIVDVQSNEPVNGHGDGHTAPDWSITGDHTVKLRAERSGRGEGRVYSITIQAVDAAGNLSGPMIVRVEVPRSMGNDKAALGSSTPSASNEKARRTTRGQP